MTSELGPHRVRTWMWAGKRGARGLHVLMWLETGGARPTSLLGASVLVSRPSAGRRCGPSCASHAAGAPLGARSLGGKDPMSCKLFAGPGRTRPDTQGRRPLNSARPGLRSGLLVDSHISAGGFPSWGRPTWCGLPVVRGPRCGHCRAQSGLPEDQALGRGSFRWPGGVLPSAPLQRHSASRPAAPLWSGLWEKALFRGQASFVCQ